MAYIYKITNLVNNKSYIGQTTNTIEYRWKEHLNCLNKPECVNRPLYRAIKKYGVQNFSIEEIEKCEENELNEKEIYWISFYNTYEAGYNLTIGGEGNTKIDRNRVIFLWKNNLSVNEIAQQLNCKRNAIAAILDSFNIPIEERLKRGYIRQGKGVYQINKDTDEIIAFYPTMSDAARAIGMTNIKSACNIGRACKGQAKTCYGFKWKFAEDI